MRCIDNVRHGGRQLVAGLVVSAVVAGGCAGSSSESAPLELVADSTLLPDPVTAKGASVDEQAAHLARRTLAGKDTAAAITAALDLAGFGIRDVNLGGRLVAEPGGASQGLAFEAGEVLMMAALEDEGFAIRLDTVAALVVGAVTETAEPAGETVGSARDALVEDLRAAADLDPADSPAHRFFARYIVELGRQGPDGYDLLDPSTSTDVTLDAVQTNLIALRLAADALVAAGETGESPAVGGGGSETPSGRIGGRSQHLPCTLSKTDGFIMDRRSFIAKSVFKEVWKRTGLDATGLGASVKWTGVALPILRSFALQAIFEPTIELIDAPPLVRTKKTTEDKDLHRLRATIEMRTGNGQWVNCLRLLANAAKLDFKLPNDGPVKGARVLWRCIEGCGSGGWVQLCALPCDNKGGIQTGNAEKNAFRSDTDGDGRAENGIQGRRQAKEVPKETSEVRRQATVGITVQLTRGNLIKDLFSVGETASGSVGPASVVSVTAEILERHGFRGATYRFPVIDWGGQDYKFHHEAGNGLVFSGVKCGGPDGDWVIELSGTLSDAYITLSWEGSIVATLASDGRGPLSGNARMLGDADARVVLDYPYEGNAKFTEADDGANLHLVLEPGTAGGSIDLPIPGNQFSGAYGGSAIDIPLTAGTFCQDAD